MRRLVGLLIAWLGTGCVSVAPPPLEGLEPYRGEGSACVVGRAPAVLTPWGVQTFEEVRLRPVVAYTEDWFAATVRHGVAPFAMEASLREVVRSAPVDAEGRFRFEDLPPGSYFVDARVTWKHERQNDWLHFAASGRFLGRHRTSTSLMKRYAGTPIYQSPEKVGPPHRVHVAARVDVAAGETADVVLVWLPEEE